MDAEIAMASLSYSTVRDPLIRRFVDEVATLLKAEIVQAVAAQRDPTRFPVKFAAAAGSSEVHLSVGAVVAEQIGKLPQAQKQALLRRNSSVMRIAADASDVPGVSLQSEKPVLDQVDLRARFAFVNENFGDRLVQSTREMMAAVRLAPEEEGTGQSAQAAGAPIKSVRLNLEQVKCVDETNPEFFGSDEIAMGGSAFSDDEAASVIKEFMVGEGFDDGDTKKFNPARQLKSFAVKPTGKFPKTYSALLGLAEKDNGGFADFLQKLFEAVKADITKILTALGAAAGAAIGGAIGGTLGTTLAGPIGTVIGTLAGLALGAIISALINAFRDDIFEPQIATFALPRVDATFPGGSLRSPTLSLTYSDHGGTYRVSYHWQLVR